MKALAVVASLVAALASPAAAAPADFLYMGAGDLAGHEALLARPDIAGVQVLYNWKMLETAPGQYDFSAIEADLAIARELGKKFVVQLQDRFFTVTGRNIPQYLQDDPQYGGGLVPQVDESTKEPYGWVAVQWNAALRQRYQALIAALAGKFDGALFAVNLPETAIDIDLTADNAGFSCDTYFAAEMDNFAAARAAFKTTMVVQYINFWPCEWENDHDYMGRAFAWAAAHNAGIGGPDIVPYRKGQMKNSYPFFNQYKGRLPYVGLAVQEPTLKYENPKTGKPFTRAEFTAFADGYLGADAIFWSIESPWLTTK